MSNDKVLVNGWHQARVRRAIPYWRHIRNFKPSRSQAAKAEEVGKYGYGVYAIPGGYAVADPSGDDDGWYLVGPLDEILTETLEMIEVSNAK